MIAEVEVIDDVDHIVLVVMIFVLQRLENVHLNARLVIKPELKIILLKHFQFSVE